MSYNNMVDGEGMGNAQSRFLAENYIWRFRRIGSRWYAEEKLLSVKVQFKRNAKMLNVYLL